MLSKDEISDLKSLISRAELCAVELRNADLSKKEADRQLENWLLTHAERNTKS